MIWKPKSIYTLLRYILQFIRINYTYYSMKLWLLWKTEGVSLKMKNNAIFNKAFTYLLRPLKYKDRHQFNQTYCYLNSGWCRTDFFPLWSWQNWQRDSHRGELFITHVGKSFGLLCCDYGHLRGQNYAVCTTYNVGVLIWKKIMPDLGKLEGFSGFHNSHTTRRLQKTIWCSTEYLL